MEGLPLNSEYIVDCELSKQICDLIADDQHELVLNKLVPLFIDYAPTKFLEGLTGDPEGYSQAEEMLTDWYQQQTLVTLIEDAMRLLGKTELCYSLDSLNLQQQD
jgi:hypothetical protein